MVWFQQSREGKGDLIYDNLAFLYVLSSFLVILWVVLFILIIRHLQQLKKSTTLFSLEGKDFFKDKVKKQVQKQRKEVFARLTPKLFLFFLLTTILFYWFSSAQSASLVTFDPYQILEIKEAATETEIKKAYRRMAIENHPDKNKSAKSTNKFIQISKAYKCLTDAKTKQLCRSYGNPDGQINYEVGIGLPSLLIKQYSSYSTFFLLFLFLLALPFLFFNYIEKQDRKRKIHLIKKQKIFELIYQTKNRNLEIGDLWILLSLASEVDTVFQGTEVLSKEDDSICRKLVLKNSSLSWKQISMLSHHAIYRIYILYTYIYNNGDSVRIAEISTLLSNKIVNLCEAFLRKKRKLMNHVGIFHIGVKLSRQLFLRKSMFSLDSFVDLKEGNDKLILQGLNYKQIRSVRKDGKRLQFFIQQFTEQNRQRIKKLILQIPQLKLQAFCSVDDQQVEKVSQHDHLTLTINITYLNPQLQSNYVKSPKFPLLVQSQYLIAVFKDDILVCRQIFKLSECRPQMTVKKKIKNLGEGIHRFQARLYSLCEPIIELKAKSEVDVVKMRKKRKIEFHEQDLYLERKKSNFFQKIIVFNEDRQELELSDSQTLAESEGKGNKKIREQKNKKKDEHFFGQSF